MVQLALKVSHSVSVMDLLQVRTQLDVTSERLSGFSEVSVSPAHGEHVLRELCAHEDKACVRNPQQQTTRTLEVQCVKYLRKLCILGMYIRIYHI